MNCCVDDTTIAAMRTSQAVRVCMIVEVLSISDSILHARLMLTRYVRPGADAYQRLYAHANFKHPRDADYTNTHPLKIETGWFGRICRHANCVGFLWYSVGRGEKTKLLERCVSVRNVDGHLSNFDVSRRRPYVQCTVRPT